MDKTKIKHDKNDAERMRIERHSEQGDMVHRLPKKGETVFHKEFGLWICRSGRSGKSGSSIDLAYNRYFEFFCISQLLEGTGYYRGQDNIITVFKPGQGVLVTPNTKHMYGGYHDRYVENTISFVGRLPNLLSSLGILSSGVITMENPHRLIDIITKAMDPGIVSQTQANIDLLNYLQDLYRINLRKTTTGDILNELTFLLQEDQSTWWTVQDMANYCAMSEVQFRTVFRKRHGMAPKKYLDLLKINSAIELLSHPGQTIADIAASLGYVDPFHFSRRFKQLTGHSPRDYRQNVLVK